MKPQIIFLLVLFFTFPVFAEIHDVSYGTVEASNDFEFKQTGTKDSFMGTLTRKSDGFTITFDIGHMAGTRISENDKGKCTFYRRHKINDHFAVTGIEKMNGKQMITTSVSDLQESVRVLKEEMEANAKLPSVKRKPLTATAKDKSIPANFWAEINKDQDLADFLIIVGTYKPKLR